jgi:hypothetical protein
VHDEYSHAADAFGGLAEILDWIRNDGDQPPMPMVAAYYNSDPTTGML